MASKSPVPVSGVCELVLEQSDLAAAEEFNAGDLGFPVVERWADEAVWVMAADRTRIGLWRPRSDWVEVAAASTSITPWGCPKRPTRRWSSGFEVAAMPCSTTTILGTPMDAVAPLM